MKRFLAMAITILTMATMGTAAFADSPQSESALDSVSTTQEVVLAEDDTISDEKQGTSISTFAASDLYWVNNWLVNRYNYSSLTAYKSDYSGTMDIRYTNGGNWRVGSEYFESGAYAWGGRYWDPAQPSTEIANIWHTNGGKFYHFNYLNPRPGNKQVAFRYGGPNYNYNDATLNAQIYM